MDIYLLLLGVHETLGTLGGIELSERMRTAKIYDGGAGLFTARCVLEI